MNTAAPSIAPEIKKLNWFQRKILCMGVDIRKEQYTAYRDRHDMAYDQKLILHHVSGSKSARPKAKAPLSYSKWNRSQVPWVDVEKVLYSDPAAATRSPPPADSDDEDDDDDASEEREEEDEDADEESV